MSNLTKDQLSIIVSWYDEITENGRHSTNEDDNILKIIMGMIRELRVGSTTRNIDKIREMREQEQKDHDDWFIKMEEQDSQPDCENHIREFVAIAGLTATTFYGE